MGEGGRKGERERKRMGKALAYFLFPGQSERGE